MRILWQLSAVNAAQSGARHRTFKSMSLDCFFELLWRYQAAVAAGRVIMPM